MFRSYFFIAADENSASTFLAEKIADMKSIFQFSKKHSHRSPSFSVIFSKLLLFSKLKLFECLSHFFSC